MMPDPMIGLVAWRLTRQLRARQIDSAAPEERDRFWTRLKPLAFLAPLAINWPGGRMVL
jgi:hypothetical protein